MVTLGFRGGRRIRISTYENQAKDVLIHADFLDKELSKCNVNGVRCWLPLYRQEVPQRPIQAFRTFAFWLIDHDYIDLLEPGRISFGYWAQDMNISKEKRLKIENEANRKSLNKLTTQ